MDKLNKIIKNVVVFLAIFLTLNFIFNTFQNDEQSEFADDNVFFLSTKSEYSRTKTVEIEVINTTEDDFTIKNDCPSEPLNVYKFENNDWVQKTSTPELNCEKAQDWTIPANEKLIISYDNWNYALFSDTGRFKVELDTEVNGEETTISSNEFQINQEGLISQLWNGVFYRPIYNGLIFLTNILPGHHLGLAIILLTLIIRTILLIPSHKSMVQQKKIQEVQPRLEKIREKYKGDQQKIAMETMAIWKEAKVNPFGSCLPLLLQFPFLIALFYVIQKGLNPDNAHLLYTTYENFSLNDINVHFLGLNLTEANVYVLPLIVGGLQYIQIKLSTANRKKKESKKNKDSEKKNEMAMATSMMAYIMPVMIAVFAASLPAGVGIYWATSTTFGIIQQLIVNNTNIGSGNGGGKDSKEPTVRVVSA